MKQYPFYEVKEYAYFSDMVRDFEQYGEMTAFENKTERWTYNDLKSMVMKCVAFFSRGKRQFYRLNIKNPVYFAAVYFGVVISDNIAVLADDRDIAEIGLNSEYGTVSDKQAKQILLSSKQAETFPETDCNAFCTMVCSSGTTSVKKGVMLSQKNLLSDTKGGMSYYEYQRGTRLVKILPYTHIFGLVVDMIAPLVGGETVCFSESSLEFFDNLRYFKPNDLHLPPVLAEGLSGLLEKTNDAVFATGGALKKIMCAGAKMNPKINAVLNRFGIKVYSGYGLTETSSGVSVNRDEYCKPDSVGIIMPCNRVKTVDGEIVVSGSNVMLGYYNDKQATDKVLKDGWLYTGDLGYIDNDGFLYITGRKNSMIIFNDGTKLMPESLEEKINELDGVVESLVGTIDVADRTCLNIYIVVEDVRLIGLIRENAIALLKQLDFYTRVFNIEFLNQPLRRNELGKLIRRD